MRKIGRNERCPCGSGKKFKKCCGGHTAEIVDAQTINHNLLQLHQKLISAVSTTYHREIEELTTDYSQATSLDEGTIEVYKTGLISWVLSHGPAVMNNRVIIDDFINNQVIPLHTKEYVQKRLNQTPSVYEVVAVDRPVKHYAMIKEVGTNELFHIPHHESNELIQGNLLIGTLVPFVDYHDFLYTMVKLFNRETETYRKLYEQHSDPNHGLKESFPNFLAEALTTGTEEFEWDDSTYEEIAQVFVDHMIEKNMDDRSISKGILLWNQFSTEERPTIKKVEAYAAALDYFIQKEVAHTAEQTQTHLAEEYGISPGTISKIYRNFILFTKAN